MASGTSRPLKLAKHSVGLPPLEPPKRARVTGTQQAIFSMSDSIQTLATAFASRQQGQSGSHAMPALAPTTPQRRTSAIQRLSQIDRDLSVRTHSLIITLFQENIAAADTYMALDVEDIELRRAWMQTTLAEHHPSVTFSDFET